MARMTKAIKAKIWGHIDRWQYLAYASCLETTYQRARDDDQQATEMVTSGCVVKYPGDTDFPVLLLNMAGAKIDSFHAYRWLERFDDDDHTMHCILFTDIDLPGLRHQLALALWEDLKHESYQLPLHRLMPRIGKYRPHLTLELID